jgi:prevent-host-death family protein
MKQVSVADLKARLSEFLAVVKRGEDVIITDRGRPVARLTNLGTSSRRQARTQELLRAGVLEPPLRHLPKDFFAVPAPADPEARLRRAVLEERSEGW